MWENSVMYIFQIFMRAGNYSPQVSCMIGRRTTHTKSPVVTFHQIFKNDVFQEDSDTFSLKNCDHYRILTV